MIIYRGKNPFQAIDPSTPQASILERPEMYEFCDARKKNGEPCRQKALYRQGRCKFHGGLSTGPKTEEGKQQSRINGAKGGRPRKTQVVDSQGLAKGKMPQDTIRDSNQRPRNSKSGDESDRKLEALERMVNALRKC